MCGIIVSETKVKKLQEGLQKITSRGPDQSRIIEKDNHLFMFNRLAIMDLSEKGMQPFMLEEHILVANAEIYNYKQLQSELINYPFLSDSDCEMLLPFYLELGEGMFELLDGEFAIVLYDGIQKKLIAARDPLGIRPLFYGFERVSKKIIFASEVKAIIDYVDQVFPFPPGHYYIDGIFTQYTDIYDINSYHNDTFDVMFQKIKDKLTKGILKRLESDAPMGFLLSGGLDSSLVCAIAQKHLNAPIRTFSIGMKEDAIDLKYAKRVANYIGSNHTEVIITKEDVLSSLEELIYNIESFDITTIRASMGMYLIAKYIHQHTDIKVLLTGEVSDELFGYKYTDFAPSEDAFQAECNKRIKELYRYDVLRADRCLAAHSFEARVPFSDTDFVRYVMAIHPMYKMNRFNMGKFILRKSFEGDLLPYDILYRDKAAFSDAVGHSLVDYLKEYAEEVYSDEVFLEKQYSFEKIVPPTKEAMLYLEIFLKYYPDHIHLIESYWMPNKDWENCNVTDPSARVLKNYGKSGQ
jgi:asparagine synthase (glutamine-hydrolysing)